jgi:hypothetical protein
MAAFFCTLVTIGVLRIVVPGHRNDLAAEAAVADADTRS